MTRQHLIGLAGLGSLVLLAAAFVFEHFGWAPCKMCLWQRWPHGAAILIGALGYIAPLAILAYAGALAAGTTMAIAAFHSGVELKWWPGPASCSGGGEDLGALSGNALLPGAADVPALVMCDTLTPFLFGLTMANWNFLASLALVGVWLWAARQKA